MFKLKTTAIFISAALMANHAYATDHLTKSANVIENNSVITSPTRVFVSDSLLVDGKATFNYESSNGNPSAIIVYGEANLGNGSIINHKTVASYVSPATAQVVTVYNGSKFVAENLTLNSTGYGFDGIQAYGNSQIELKGTTNINLTTTLDGGPLSNRAEGISTGQLTGEPDNNMSFKAENINIVFRTTGLSEHEEQGAAGIWLWNNEGDINITGKTNIDLQTASDGDLYGIDYNYGFGRAITKNVFMNDVKIKLRSDAEYKDNTDPNFHSNIVNAIRLHLYNAQTEINKLNVDAYGNRSVYGTELIINDEDLAGAGITIHDAAIRVAGGDKASLYGLTMRGHGIKIGKLVIDSEGGENAYMFYARQSNAAPYFTDDITLGSQNAYDTVKDTLYSIYGSVDIPDNKLVAWGTMYTDYGEIITINTKDNSYIYGNTFTRADNEPMHRTGGRINLTLNGSHSRWDMTEDSTLTNLTLNGSTLHYLPVSTNTRKLTRDAATFKTLTVNGDYTGNNANIVMNTQLGDDASPTDRMIIAGNTSGTTNVKVLNAGGAGGLTTDGIELISVGGNSDGEFKQNGRIVAGAYDYTLQRGEGQNDKNWYLSSALSPEPPQDPVDPQDPVTPVAPADPQSPTPTPREHAVRPEAGLYGMNLQAANTMFNTRLQDRLGETHYVDALTGEKAVTSLWLRNVGGHTRQHDSSEQLAMQANRYVMQLGGDIAQWSSDNTDRYHLGLMAGYASQKARAENQRNGNRADSRISGYSVGLYGTWLQDNETREGAYVDTWAQYSWFDNTVSGRGVESEEYDSRGFTASVESGYTWKLADISERNALYIQPKAQVTWMGVKADEHKEANGTRVEGNGDGNIQTRVGVRLFGKGHNKLDDGKDRTFQPFVEANWIHNSKDFGTSLNGENVTLAGTRNIGELKAGVEGQLTKNVSLWGNVGQQIGDKGYSDTAAMVGIKATF